MIVTVACDVCSYEMDSPRAPLALRGWMVHGNVHFCPACCQAFIKWAADRRKSSKRPESASKPRPECPPDAPKKRTRATGKRETPHA